MTEYAEILFDLRPTGKITHETSQRVNAWN